MYVQVWCTTSGGGCSIARKTAFQQGWAMLGASEGEGGEELLHTSFSESLVDLLLDNVAQILVLFAASFLDGEFFRLVTRVTEQHHNVIRPFLQILWQSDAGLSISDQEAVSEGPVEVVSTLTVVGEETEFDHTSVVFCLGGLVRGVPFDLVCFASDPDGGGGGLSDVRVVNDAFVEWFSRIATEHERVIVDRLVLTLEHQFGVR